ncbi:MAG: TolC family protein, partial [Candidatus Thorarchaeota archaeon]
MNKRLVRISLICITLLLCWGCAANKEYTYERVVSEYGLERFETTPSVKPKFKLNFSYLKKPISVLDAIRIAIDNNPDILLAISRIRESEATIDEANAAFWPTLRFYSEYTKADSPSTYLFKKMDQRRLSPGTDFNDPGKIENFEMGFSARYNIYSGGRDILRKKIA